MLAGEFNVVQQAVIKCCCIQTSGHVQCIHLLYTKWMQRVVVNEFYIHGSVHRNSILKRSNKMQQYAGIYLLQNYCTCFGCPSHRSSGVHKTVSVASGMDHITYPGNNLPLLEEGCYLDTWYGLYQKLQLQFYVLLMMGAIDTRNM